MPEEIKKDKKVIFLYWLHKFCANVMHISNTNPILYNTLCKLVKEMMCKVNSDHICNWNNISSDPGVNESRIVKFEWSIYQNFRLKHTQPEGELQ